MTAQVWPKDYYSEIISLRWLSVARSPTKPWMPIFKYTNDGIHIETIKTPSRLVREIEQNGYAVGDCDDVSTLLAALALSIGRQCEFVAMGFAPKSLSHVCLRVKEPKSGAWILIDGVAGPREREAASKAVEILVRPVE